MSDLETWLFEHAQKMRHQCDGIKDETGENIAWQDTVTKEVFIMEVERLRETIKTIETNRDNWESRCGEALNDRDRIERKLNAELKRHKEIVKAYEKIDLNKAAGYGPVKPALINALTDAIYQEIE